MRALVGGHAASFDVEFDLLDYATVQVFFLQQVIIFLF